MQGLRHVLFSWFSSRFFFGTQNSIENTYNIDWWAFILSTENPGRYGAFCRCDTLDNLSLWRWSDEGWGLGLGRTVRYDNIEIMLTFGAFRGRWTCYVYVVTFTGFAETFLNVRRFEATWPEAPPDFYKAKGWGQRILYPGPHPNTIRLCDGHTPHQTNQWIMDLGRVYYLLAAWKFYGHVWLSQRVFLTGG